MQKQIEKQDYVIIKEKDSKVNKGILIRVTSTKHGYSGVIIDKNYGKDGASDKTEFEISQVLTNLGPEPKPGSVYGCKVEILHETIETKVGLLLFWRKLPKEERLRITNVIDNSFLQLQKDGLLLNKALELTVREAGGKWAGYYRHTGKEEVADELCLKPKFLSKPLLPTKELMRLFAHEWSHGLWFTRMSQRWQARWIKAYLRNVTLARIDTAALDRLRSGLVSAGRISKFSKTLDELQTKELKEVLKWLKRMHCLDAREIGALLNSGDDLKNYWPKSGLALQNKNVIISDYALSKPCEFWAEAFCFHYTKTQKLPKSIRKLMVKTLTELKKGESNEG